MSANDESAGSRLWDVESLRVTTFHSVGEIISEPGQIWELAANQKPEQVSSRPRESLTQAEGTYENQALIVTCRPDRVDLNFRPLLPLPNAPVTGFFTMGHFLDLLPRFLEVSKNWLRVGPSITRVAFGSVLLRGVSDLPSGNRVVQGFLPDVKLDADGRAISFIKLIGGENRL